VHVLNNMVSAVKPGGLVLDLQVIRPNPLVETNGRIVCEIDGAPLFRTADAAVAAIDALVRTGALIDEAQDDHDVRKHYANGTELIADFATSERRIPADAVPELKQLAEPCTLRERCCLRRLAVRGPL
jgi:hypothetical protein